MFYTKYRPQTFKDLTKPDKVADSLLRQLASGKTAHAYLFVGPRGTGKTTTARLLAKALSCENPLSDGDVCGLCAFCISVEKGSLVDLIEIDAASNRGIDDIRSLRETVKLSPFHAKKKVYIIDEVHMLTTEAFNALLKTLEEPPSHVVFILCTTESHKVPDTIKSRCQVLVFERASTSHIVKKLKLIAKDQGIDVSDAVLKSIAKASSGAYRDAENMLQQYFEGGVEPNSISERLSYIHISEFVDYLLLGDKISALSYIDKLYNEGSDLYTWNGELLLYLRDLVFLAVGAEASLIDASDEVLSKMEEQSSKLEVPEYVGLIEAFIDSQAKIKRSTIPQLPLELAVLTALSNPHCVSSDIDVGHKLGEEKQSLAQKDHAGIKSQSTDLNLDYAEDLSGSDLVSANVSADVEAVSIAVDEIYNKWADLLKAVVPYNHSVSALLKAAKPKEIQDDTLVLEVFYSFHKERLESPKNKEIVQKGLKEVFSKTYSIKCVLGEKKKKTSQKTGETGDLTDYNVITPSVGVDIFDGSLPI